MSRWERPVEMLNVGLEVEGPTDEELLNGGGQENEENDVEELQLPDLGIVVPPPSHVMCDRALHLEKQQENSLVWTAQSKMLVDSMLDDVYAVLQPTKEQQEARRYVIHFVDNFVKSRIQGSHITVFGSFVMDLYTGSSDLDLSLNVGYAPVERSRSDRIGFLRKLTRALHGLQNGKNGSLRHTVRKIEPVMRAAVPVVKFVEGRTNIECDVSMENRDGVLKSELLGVFALIDPRFRQLCFLLKAWAKVHNVNDSKKGTLNSLSIILLVAFHLQTRSPPILPSFSVLLEGLVLEATQSCTASVKERVALHIERGFGRDNKETISQLFASFFVKLLAVESLWEQGLCASAYEGKWVSKVWAKNHLGCMSVEDFAERSQNCARAVREKEFDIIHQCFRETLAQLNYSTTTASQVAEMKHTLFGFKGAKRPSEEPLAQPFEKQQRVGNGYESAYNSADYGNPSLVPHAYGREHHGGILPHQVVHVNHDMNVTQSRQQGDTHYSFQGHHQGWAAHGQNLMAVNRGIISPMPGDQVHHYGAPGHNHVRHPTIVPQFPQQHLQFSQNLVNFSGDGSLLGARPGDSVHHPGYNGYHPGWSAPGVVGMPLLHAPYTPQAQIYYPEVFVNRADGTRDRTAWQGYGHLHRPSHPSRNSSRGNGRG